MAAGGVWGGGAAGVCELREKETICLWIALAFLEALGYPLLALMRTRRWDYGMVLLQ